MIKLLEKNVGRSVVIRGNQETISHVLSDGTFKILRETQSEGIAINHYTLADVETASEIFVQITND
jgi:hypothetical protein